MSAYRRGAMYQGRSQCTMVLSIVLPSLYQIPAAGKTVRGIEGQTA